LPGVRAKRCHGARLAPIFLPTASESQTSITSDGSSEKKCAFARSCPAAAHDSICPAARLGSGASTGFLGAEGGSGGRAGCARAECAFARSCPAAAHDSICPAARLGSLGADGGSQGHRRPTWVGGNGYTLAARAR
jgi:hypothetical protein